MVTYFMAQSSTIEETLPEALTSIPAPVTTPTLLPISSTLTPRTVRRRRAITDAQRKALRDYFRKNLESKPSQKDLEDWFNSRYDHKISQSSISEILSPKWAYLDEVESLNRPEAKKRKASYWPHLEDALFHWYKIQEGKGIPITTKAVKEMAGWFSAFKQRHQITLAKDKALGELVLCGGAKPPKR